MGPTPEEQRALASAYRLLSHRPRTEAELRFRLSRRFSPATVERVVARLREAGLLDDSAFARAWVDYRQRVRPRSSALVERELRSRGVPPEVAREAVSALDDLESALRAGAKVAPRLANEGERAFRERMWAYLRRRGFGGEAIRRAVELLWERCR